MPMTMTKFESMLVPLIRAGKSMDIFWALYSGYRESTQGEQPLDDDQRLQSCLEDIRSLSQYNTPDADQTILDELLWFMGNYPCGDIAFLNSPADLKQKAQEGASVPVDYAEKQRIQKSLEEQEKSQWHQTEEPHAVLSRIHRQLGDYVGRLGDFADQNKLSPQQLAMLEEIESGYMDHRATSDPNHLQNLTGQAQALIGEVDQEPSSELPGISEMALHTRHKPRHKSLHLKHPHRWYHSTKRED